MSSEALKAQPGSGRVLRHPGAALPAHLQNRFGSAAAAAAAESGGDAGGCSQLGPGSAQGTQEELQGWAGGAGEAELGKERGGEGLKPSLGAVPGAGSSPKQVGPAWALL